MSIGTFALDNFSTEPGGPVVAVVVEVMFIEEDDDAWAALRCWVISGAATTASKANAAIDVNTIVLLLFESRKFIS